MATIISEVRDVLSRRVQTAGPDELVALIASLSAAEAPLEFAPPRAPIVGERFEVIGDTVRDRRTGLEWTRKNVSKERLNWADAKAACEKLGDGWRMPEIWELLSLVDYGRSDPAIDKSVFECESAWYWAATDYKPVSGCAWLVVFSGGGADGGYRVDGFVRAVRGGQF